MSLWHILGQPALSPSRKLVWKPSFLSLAFCRSRERLVLHANKAPWILPAGSQGGLSCSGGRAWVRQGLGGKSEGYPGILPRDQQVKWYPLCICSNTWLSTARENYWRPGGECRRPPSAFPYMCCICWALCRFGGKITLIIFLLSIPLWKKGILHSLIFPLLR